MLWQRELRLLVAFSACVWSSGRTSLQCHPRGISWPRFFTPTWATRERSVSTCWRGTGRQNSASDISYLWDESSAFFWRKMSDCVAPTIFSLISFIVPSDNQVSSHPSESRVGSEWRGRASAFRGLCRIWVASSSAHRDPCHGWAWRDLRGTSGP